MIKKQTGSEINKYIPTWGILIGVICFIFVGLAFVIDEQLQPHYKITRTECWNETTELVSSVIYYNYTCNWTMHRVYGYENNYGGGYEGDDIERIYPAS